MPFWKSALLKEGPFKLLHLDYTCFCFIAPLRSWVQQSMAVRKTTGLSVVYHIVVDMT